MMSCTKDEVTPTPPSNDPVFGAQGTIDGQTIDLNAGENNTFMSTDIIEVKGVEQYQGTLLNGETSMLLSISDGLLDIPDLNTDIVAEDGIKLAPNNSQALATFSKSTFSNSESIEEVIWTIDGETYSSSQIWIMEPGKYEICADVVFENGTTGSTCNSLIIGYQKNANATVNYLVGQNNEIVSFVDAPNHEISSIHWFKNDVLVSEEFVYKDFSSDINSYALKAKVRFSNGVYREREIWVNRNNPEFKIQDLSIIENQSSLSWDHKATVEITINGEKYTSFPQNNDQQISVLNIFDYGTNDDGETVTFIEGSLNTTFIKESTEEVVNGSFDIRFGVAH
jgi:hypothetical protein